MEWLISFHEITGGREYNPYNEVAVAQLLKEDTQLGNRLVLKVYSKETRDNVVR